MGFLGCSLSAVAILGAAMLPKLALSQVTSCEASSNPDFTYEVIPSTNFEIRWSVDTEAETISFEVVYAGMAWTSIGFSEEGEMIGSDAVIGLPDDGMVVEYDLAAKDVDAVVPFDDPEITNMSVTQDETSTVVTFTRPLAPTGDKLTISATPGDETWLIWAFGVDNALDNHGPDNRSNVLLDLFCGDTDTAESVPPTATPSMAPTLADDAVTPTATETPDMSPEQTEETPAPADVDEGGELVTAAPTTFDGGLAPTADGSAAPTEVGAPTEEEDPDAEDDLGTTGGATRGVGRGGAWLAVAVTGLVAVLGGVTLVSW